MLVKYKKQANIAAGLWLVTFAGTVAILHSLKANLWESGDLVAIFTMLVNIGTYWFAFWAYAKAKGYSSFLGLVLPLLSIVGLIILVALRDKHPETTSDTAAK